MPIAVNQHVTEYLSYYLKLPDPGFATLLRGNWGGGKSWFLRDFIDHYPEKSFLYVSLYGVKSYNEIEDALFQQIHPLMASKGMKVAGKILNGLLKSTLKIDLFGKENSTTISTGLSDVNWLDQLKKADDKILVFDDLERCSIEIHNLLGYLNQFVENNGSKMILLANETEIIKAEKSGAEKADSEQYLLIKEKLIGKAFEILPDIEGAMNHFVAELPDGAFKDWLKDNYSVVLEVFMESGYKNLRHLRQSIFDLNRLFQFFPDSAHKKQGLTIHLVQVFCAISFEVKKGELLESNIQKLLTQYIYAAAVPGLENPLKAINQKYKVFLRVDYPMDAPLWQKFFELGTLDQSEVKTSIEHSRYYMDEHTPNWEKLWYFMYLNDDEFERIFKIVWNDFQHGKIDNKYQLLHITCTLHYLSKINLITESSDEILKAGRKNVVLLETRQELIVDQHEQFPLHASYGKGYTDESNPKIQQFIKFIQQRINKANSASLQSKADALMETLRTSVYTFLENITLTNSTNNLYFKIPILPLLSIPTFMEAFRSLPNSEKDKVSYALHKRYALGSFNNELKAELPWLKKMRTALIREAKAFNNKVSGHIIKGTVLPDIEKSIAILSKS